MIKKIQHNILLQPLKLNVHRNHDTFNNGHRKPLNI